MVQKNCSRYTQLLGFRRNELSWDKWGNIGCTINSRNAIKIMTIDINLIIGKCFGTVMCDL